MMRTTMAAPREPAAEAGTDEDREPGAEASTGAHAEAEAAPVGSHLTPERSDSEAGTGAGRGADAAPVLVGVVMGSDSDWPTMRRCAEVLSQFGVAHECRVVSAHRTPDLLVEYAQDAERRGLQAIVAGAGGAAHLPGMLAAVTIVPVIGVPVASRALNGLDSLLSIVQMPAGVPVATMAIGEAGAANAGLLAVAMLARREPDLAERLTAYRSDRAAQVRAARLDG